MNKTKLTLAAAATLCAATAAALPQTGQSKDPQGPSKSYGEAHGQTAMHDYCSLDKLMGAKVRFGSPAGMHPDDDGGAGQSAQQDKEMNKGSDERAEGEVADVLIGTEDGHLRWAVVSCGGMLGMGEKHVAVPFDALRWRATGEGEGEGHFELAATKEQLERQPEFDLDQAREKGLDTAVAMATSSWKAVGYAQPDASKPREAGGEREGGQPVVAAAGKQVAMVPVSFVAGSELDELDVRAAGSPDDVGGVSRTIVSPAKGCVEFVVVEHGGTMGVGGEKILVPFRALDVREEREDDETHVVLAVNKTKDQLESAVKYEEPDEGVLDEAAAERARKFFGVKDDQGTWKTGDESMDKSHDGHDHQGHDDMHGDG